MYDELYIYNSTHAIKRTNLIKNVSPLKFIERAHIFAFSNAEYYILTFEAQRVYIFIDYTEQIKCCNIYFRICTLCCHLSKFTERIDSLISVVNNVQQYAGTWRTKVKYPFKIQ